MNNQNKSTQNRSDTVSNWRDKSQTKRSDDYKSSQSSSMDRHTSGIREGRQHYSSRHYDTYSKYNRKYTPDIIEKKKEFSLTDDDFPELGGNASKPSEVSTEYLEKCKKTKEEEAEEREGWIDTSDPQYWDSYRWKGPMFLRSSRKDDDICSNSRTLYSRDNYTWFPSWKETFTDTEWNNMDYQDHMETSNEIMQYLANKHEAEIKKAYDLYHESGHVNLCLHTHLDGIEYENYVDQLEEAWNNSEETTDYEDDDLDYLSDGSY
jgi:hypothetical protein